MAKLRYFTVTSLDGHLADGEYDWSAPDEQAFAFITECLRPVGTYLIGRRNYQTMAVWDTPEVIPDAQASTFEFARVWQAARKVVFSRTLESVDAPNTHLEREFQPQVIREWKAQFPADLSISGPTLAAEAFRAGLVDEIQLLFAPFLLGGGIPVLPSGVRQAVNLIEECRVGNGWVFARYGLTA